MKLLLVCTPDDDSYLDRFQRLPALLGHKVVKTTTSVVNAVTLDVLCKKHSIDAVVCCQTSGLLACLQDTPDWIKPPGNKQITLDDFAGSLLTLRSGKEVLVCNPLSRLFSVAYEKFVLNTYLSKLTQPYKWLKQTDFHWEQVTYESQAKTLAEIEAADLCAVDIETPWPQNELREMSCVSYTCYDRTLHTTRSFVVPFDEVWHWEFVVKANASASRKVFQNGLYDNTYFARWGCPVHNWLFDTFHLFHSWLSELPKRLDFIAPITIRKTRYWKTDGKTGNAFDLHRYCALDGWTTINSLLGIVHAAPDWALTNYTDHEFPLVFPSLHAGLEGLECDVERFTEISEIKAAQAAKEKAEIQDLLSEPNFNPGSSQQNAKVFELLGVSAVDGTGKIPTLRATALHPLNGYVLERLSHYKESAKQVSTYFDPSKLWHGRIFYALNPGGTDTLRAASSESAYDCGWQIQNIPNRDDSFKQCVLAPKGWYIAEVDKKQSEARCVAYLSGDTNLLALVESSHDYHSWNASKFFGVGYSDIYDEVRQKTLDKPLRDLSKRTNHGANYNMGANVMLDTMGPKRVAEAKIQLKLPKVFSLKSTCQYLLDRYVATYPAVKGRWYTSIVHEITTTKKLVSPFGWVRLFHGTPKDNKLHLNAAVAHAPQNLSVSVINKEWYKIWRSTVYGALKGRVRIKAQIHDSLLFIYRSTADAFAVQEMMDLTVQVVGSDGITRSMFIPSDLSIGKAPTRRWSEAK